MDVSIFTQIGFVVLVGLACKNAILIVEYAKQQMDTGVERHEAAVEACRLRLCPYFAAFQVVVAGVKRLANLLHSGKISGYRILNEQASKQLHHGRVRKRDALSDLQLRAIRLEPSQFEVIGCERVTQKE